MNTRILGKNGPALTEIGFGSWALGGPWIYGWGPADDGESVKAIHRAIDKGVNWIDTAAVYGFGRSEEVVAKALRDVSNDVFVATKCGLVPDGKGDVYRNSRPESIRKEAEDSLRRLNVECIGLYQIHWPDVNVPYEDSWGTMVDLQKDGKVRYIGVSNYDVGMLKRCMSVAPVQSLQPPYSMLTRDVEKEVLPFCRENDIGVVVYSPMQSGLLTGAFDKKKLAPDDWRHKIDWFQEPELSKALAFVDRLRPLGGRVKGNVAQVAIRWVLSNTAVTAAIVGARTPSQVDSNIGAASIELSAKDLVEVSTLIDEFYGGKK